MSLIRLLVFALTFMPVLVLADTTKAGRVAFMRGQASAADSQSSESRALKRDELIFSKDSISVGDKGLVQIVFTDKTMLYLKAGTSINIEQYLYELKSDKKNNVLIKLLKGSMRSITGSIGKKNPEKVKYKNKVATIGIRGSAIELTETRVTFDFGKGTMETELGKVNLTEGDSASANRARSKPQKFFLLRENDDPVVIARVLMDTELKNISTAVKNLCNALPLENSILLVGLQPEISNFKPAVLFATLKGLKHCLSPEELSILLSATVMLHPELAPELVEKFYKGYNALKIEVVLKAILKGLLKPDQNLINQVLLSAIDIGGLNKQQAQSVLKDMQNRGYCVL